MKQDITTRWVAGVYMEKDKKGTNISEALFLHEKLL